MTFIIKFAETTVDGCGLRFLCAYPKYSRSGFTAVSTLEGSQALGQHVGCVT